MTGMLRSIGALRVGICLVLNCAATLCLKASVESQDTTGSTHQPVTQGASEPGADFEVQINAGKPLLVRRKGTQEWKESANLSEPVVVGFLDGNRIYVESKALHPPKVKKFQDPAYPEAERKSGNEGRVFLHIVVDAKGNVRMPMVDSSPSLEFSNSAIEAAKKWSFEPAKLNGQPVATLIVIAVRFRLTHPPLVSVHKGVTSD
jgi:TonB family protein